MSAWTTAGILVVACGLGLLIAYADAIKGCVRAWLRPVERPAPTPAMDELTEEELDLALARPADQDPTWRAVHQLIHVAEDNANTNAHEDIQDHGVCAGYVGGAAHLRMLRDELARRRKHGLELLGREVLGGRE